jgi:hypothetical protein
MTPRVELKAIEMLQAGQLVTKYTLAEIAPCHQRTAQRTLTKLHKSSFMRVAKWSMHYKQWIPVYSIAATENARKPKAKTNAQRSRKYYSDPDNYIHRINAQRAKYWDRRNKITLTSQESRIDFILTQA